MIKYSEQKWHKAFLILLVMGFVSFGTSGQGVIFDLNSSNKNVDWKVKSQAEVPVNGSVISTVEYDNSAWVKAIVPGTVFSSYVAAGLERDPNYANNISNVTKSKYDRNFWYRTKFTVPANYSTGKIWLNFDGVNRDGDVYVNGSKLGTIKGFVQRGKFDITSLIKIGGENALAVLVYLPQRPVSNSASPTYASSDGWDWMPSVPGLNSGIQDDVFLSNSGNISIIDPFIKTGLPNNSSANISILVDLQNNSATTQNAKISGLINPGNISFSQDITIDSEQTKSITLDYNTFSQLIIHNPKLWWPNGYGDPNMYSCSLKVNIGDVTSDSSTVNFGIKKYTYDTDGNVLHVSINGTRIFLKGGSWGMPEYLLRCNNKDYDTKLMLHKDMNFNIIRNWIGSTTDEGFYEACDKYGMLIWDEFWLNNGGGMPADINVFNSNVIEKIKRYRNHPSIALWCGENEGYPGAPLDDWLKADVAQYDGPHYHSNSHSDALTGSGPWTNATPSSYFSNVPQGWGLRTELGTAVFTNFESFKLFIPKANWWPRNELWNTHYFGQNAGNAGPDTYFSTVNNSYGTATGIEDFCKKAQLVNIEVNKAMFEGWLSNMWNDASGLIIWMSQSAYPSMVWQTYDYYYDATGAYWGAKKACEPLHILWNSADNSIKVSNTSNSDYRNLTAEASIFNKDGNEVTNLKKSKILSVSKNSLANCFNLIFPNLDMAYNKTATASSTTSDGAGKPMAVTDGNSSTRWSSNFNDPQWIYVDLGSVKTINEVWLNWESAYAKAFKIQVSNDTSNWMDVFSTTSGTGGTQVIKINATDARYVRMYGTQRGTQWGYSLWDFEVYGSPNVLNPLTDVHFIKLALKDSIGNLLSDNFYWRGIKKLDYTGLNTLLPVNLTVNSSISKVNDKCIIDANITNPSTSSSIAFAIRIQVVKSSTGERILPFIINDNYFSLMKGETKKLHIIMDTIQLGGDVPKLIIQQYNSYDPTIIENKTINSNDIQLSVIPNPFTNNISFKLNLQKSSNINIVIYNLTGQTIATLTRKSALVGKNTISWDGHDSNGSEVKSGIYFYTANVNGCKYPGKLIKEK